jgi:5-methylcytosine-specific restriction endonuclease McrA
MDRNLYSEDWSDVIRPSILKRDRYQCRHCGIRHKIRVYKNSRGKYVECDEFIEQWAKNNNFNVFTVYLHVAHLNQDKSDNRPENLMSLCPSCHSKYDASFKKFGKIKYSSKVDNPLADLLDMDDESISSLLNSDAYRDCLKVIARALQPYSQNHVTLHSDLFGLMARLSSIYNQNQ